MPVVRSSPAGLAVGTPYDHVAVGSGARQVFVAGQVGTDAEGRVAVGDLAGQVGQALRNVDIALASVRASFDDVLRLTFYVVDWSPEKIDDFMAGIGAVAGELGLPQPMPPASLIGVDHLFHPDNLVEVEANAVLD